MANNSGMVISGTDYSVESHLHYTLPKVNDRGSKNVNVLNKQGMKSTLISTPLMTTWGVNEYVDEATGKKTYDLALQFPTPEYPNPEAEQFLENLKALEQRIKDDAVTHSKEWFNKAKMSSEVVDALWTPMLRYPKDKQTGEPDYDRAPTLKVKIPFWKDDFNVDIFDTKGKPLFPNEDDASVTPQTLVTKGAKVATIIKNGGIWFANGKFGTTWRLEQVMVQPRATIKGVCHIRLTDSDKSEMEKQADHDETDDTVAETSNTNVTVNDSDDEDESSTHVEEVHEPPPVVKKKRVVKKKTAVTNEDED